MRLHRLCLALPNLGTLYAQQAVPGRYNGAYADTSGYDFPEEPKEEGSVWKEVAIWVGVAAFVAFFVIKVFIEGDKDVPATDDGGKDIPPALSPPPAPVP